MRTYYGTYFGQVTSKKNSKTPFKKRNGTLGVRMKKEARDQEKAMSEAFSSDFDEQKFAKGYFDNVELEVIVEFYNKDAHRRDIDNQLTSVMDALVKGGNPRRQPGARRSRGSEICWCRFYRSASRSNHSRI